MDPALFLRTAKDSMEPMRARHPFQTLAAALAPSVSRCLPPAAAIAAALTALFSRPAGAPAPPPKHGLTGSYYVGTQEAYSDVRPSGQDWYVQVWMDPNDFQLPRPFTAPAATAPAAIRVDPQIAFGQGKGFVLQNGKQTRWWPTDFPIPADWVAHYGRDQPWAYLAAVIWKGYLHLPKAGTYYLSTASRGASAVYLNQARVALNGTNGLLVSDAFTYAKEDLRDYLQNLAYGREDLLFSAHPDADYVVPVTVETPRDVAIEVRYNSWRWESSGRGIDLFWVTPDSPRDASGKPVAHIVPSDVLYTEPPGPIGQPTVRSANSMLSADFLYFPSIRTDKDVTVTVRLADKDGNPVAGKRVHIGSLVSYGGADLIKQPEKPTNEKGETTARIRPGEGYTVTHDSKILATDVTDLVDVAQVGHVTFQAGTVVSFFFPDAFSPYYDPNVIKVEPLPLMAGRPVTVSVALENRTKDAAELTATFKATAWNIGGVRWPEIGKVEHIRLKPSEARRVGINWTPGQAQEHICLKVEVSVLFDGRAGGMSEGKVLAAFALPAAIWAQRGGAVPQQSTPTQGTVQRNMGPVEPCAPPNPADPTMFGLPGVNVMNSRYGNFRNYRNGETHTVDPSTYPFDPEKDEKWPHAHPGIDITSHDAKDFMTSPGEWKHEAVNLPFTSPITGEVRCEHKVGNATCEGDPYNTISVVSCDGQYTVQFLHASRVDVQNGQSVSRGTQLGATGGFAAGEQGKVGVHLHVQVRKNDKDGKPDSYVDPLSEGPLVDPPSCDPWPCPQVGPRPGPPHQNQGPISKAGGPLRGPVKKRAKDFGKHVQTDIWQASGDSLAVKRFRQWDRTAKKGARAAKDPPDSAYERLAVAASDSVDGYLDALTASMERYGGAEAAGDRSWTARHFTAMQLYLKRLADALRRDADATETEGKRLPPDDAATEARLRETRQQVMERLRRTGLTPEDFKALRAAGVAEETARATMYRVMAYPQQSMAGKLMDPEEGYIDVNPLPVRSIRAMLFHSAIEQRKLADEAERIAGLPPGDDTGDASGRGLVQTFLVGNAHDREETVDLLLRPISIPPDWKLSLANADQSQSGTGSVGPRMQEAETGKHYAVRLPAKGEIKVASVLIPVGEVGAHTTARWAVEGKIGDDLIGGMVLEMNVPYTIADLKLPPVGSKEVEEELPAPSKARARTVAKVAAGIVIMGVLVLSFVLWRRRRPKVAP